MEQNSFLLEPPVGEASSESAVLDASLLDAEAEKSLHDGDRPSASPSLDMMRSIAEQVPPTVGEKRAEAQVGSANNLLIRSNSYTERPNMSDSFSVFSPARRSSFSESSPISNRSGAGSNALQRRDSFRSQHGGGGAGSFRGSFVRRRSFLIRSDSSASSIAVHPELIFLFSSYS